MINPDLATHWYNAYNHPLGVYLRTSDPTRLKSLLYSTRAKLADPDLMTLAIRTSPQFPAAELWLVHAEAPNG